ncbi:MAG: hypothetical protein EXR39_07430 [Betaproteobacteria bacterium]|nr:hypothetical protein [Betaproteobacteria bacterium]
MCCEPWCKAALLVFDPGRHASHVLFVARVPCAVPSPVRTAGRCSISHPVRRHEQGRCNQARRKLGIDYAATYSCMVGQPVHCGRCRQCIGRREAFREASVEEPRDFYRV